MKSSISDLARRGFLTEQQATEYLSYSYKEWTAMLSSSDPVQRSGAARALTASGHYNDLVLARSVLEQLCREKALYTRIEFCRFLQKGDEPIAGCMCSYLGVIGNNQHRVLPAGVSRKKSYPLPRDLIARTLGNMSPSIADTLLHRFPDLPPQARYELPDALGFLLYSHPQSATLQCFERMMEICTPWLSEELMLWKIIVCCSAFPLPESREWLREVLNKPEVPAVIKAEAERSFSFIKKAVKGGCVKSPIEL